MNKVDILGDLGDLGTKTASMIDTIVTQMRTADLEAATIARQWKLSWHPHEAECLRFADTHFFHGLIGSFSNGKTTLACATSTLNVLHKAGGVLPTGVLPTTVCPTVFCYATRPQVTLCWRDGLEQARTLADLAQIRLEESAATYRDLMEIRIGLPEDSLKTYTLCDTAGLEDEERQTEKTSAAIQKADLITVVLRLGPDGIANAEELAALKKALPAGIRRFYVVNRDEGASVDAVALRQLWSALASDNGGPPGTEDQQAEHALFVLNAHQALVARLAFRSGELDGGQFENALRQSNILAYEAAILHELSKNRLSLKARAWIPFLLDDLSILEGALDDLEDQKERERFFFREKRQSIARRIDDIKTEREKIEQIFDTIQPEILDKIEQTWNTLFGSLYDEIKEKLLDTPLDSTQGFLNRLRLGFSKSQAKVVQEEMETLVRGIVKQQLESWQSDSDDPNAAAFVLSRYVDRVYDQISNLIFILNKTIRETLGSMAAIDNVDVATLRQQLLEANINAIHEALENTADETLMGTAGGMAIGAIYSGLIALGLSTIAFDMGATLVIMIAGTVIGAVFGWGDPAGKAKEKIIKKLDMALKDFLVKNWPLFKQHLEEALTLQKETTLHYYDTITQERRHALETADKSCCEEIARLSHEIGEIQQDTADLVKHEAELTQHLGAAEAARA